MDIKMKLIVLGDTNVGKTSLIQSYIMGYVPNKYCSTVGIDFLYKNLTINNHNVDLHIWDTTGQERFMSIVRPYYKGSHAIMLIFDLNNLVSFNHIETWLREIYNNIEESTYMLYLIGNKNDCEIFVSKDVIQTLLDKYPNIKYMETCAKSNTNINLAFDTIVTDCITHNMYQIKNNNIILKKDKTTNNNCCY